MAPPVVDPEAARDLCGRTADLRHAYKQVAPRPSPRFAVALAVIDLE